MAYCTTQDLIERFDERQLAVLVGRDVLDALNDEPIGRAIADAVGEIDSYVGARYDLPLATVPARLTAVACDIAFYRLHPAAPPDDVRQRYVDAVAWLKAIVAGNADLLLDDGGTSAGSARFEAPERVFSRERLRDY